MKFGKLAVLPLFLALASCARDPKVQAQKYVDQGNKFFNRGKLRQASIMYQNAIHKDKLSGEAYYRLALTDLKLNALGDAVKMLRYAIDLQPTNADAIAKLATLYEAVVVTDPQHAPVATKEIKELTDRLLALDPRSYDAHRIVGQLAYVRKDYAEATKELSLANEVNPLQSDVVQTYFLTLAATDRFPEAEKLAWAYIEKDKTFPTTYDLLYLYYRQQNRVDDAERVLKLKTENNPTNTQYMLQLADHYSRVNRLDDMEAVLKKMTDEKQFPDGRLMVGDFFLSRRDYPRAQKEYEDALKALPKEKVTFQKRLVELFSTSGNISAANDLLATILKDNAKDQDALEMRATLMINSGNRDQINQAASDLQTLVTKTPGNYLLRFNYARALLAKGDMAQGQLQLEESVKLRPEYVPARELLASVYYATHETGKALKTSEEVFSYDRNNLGAHLVHSKALVDLGDLEKAALELEFITKNYPQNLEARYLTAHVAYQQKDFKKAEKLFGDLNKTYPSDQRGIMGLADTLAAENRMPDALKLMEGAIQANPTQSEYKMALGNLEVRDKKFDAALQIFTALLADNPKSAELYARRGWTYLFKGDSNQALDNFRLCSDNAPTNTECLTQYGVLLETAGHGDQAQPVYEKVLKLQPDNPTVLNNLAYMKAEQGVDLDRALSMAQQARQKAPSNIMIADTLGWIYLKKNLNDDAVRVFKDLVQQSPNIAAFHYHFGMALLQTGDKPSAKKELEAAMRNNPTKDDGPKIRQLLQSL